MKAVQTAGFGAGWSCHERVQADNGFITVPDGPGLGVTLNEDLVLELLVAESA